MALTAFRETLVHAVSVRQAMAISTFRNRHVLVSVTGRTSDLAVLGRACSKSCESRVVTRSTELRVSRCRICQSKWLMSLMTSCTVSLSHQFVMRFVAINTARDGAVGVCMAEVTSESCVLAWACNHLLVRTRVTGDTNNFVLAFQSNVERLVRVVAAQARSFYFIVSAAFMTVTTSRNVFS